LNKSKISRLKNMKQFKKNPKGGQNVDKVVHILSLKILWTENFTSKTEMRNIYSLAH